jgi:hypothetical protein
MMTTPLRAAAAALALFAALVTAGCSDTPGENTAQACEALSQYETALTDLENSLTPDATVDEVRAARDEVAAAAANLDGTISDVARDRIDALGQAWSDLSDSITDIDGDATLQESADDIRQQAQQLKTARSALSTALQCG